VTVDGDDYAPPGTLEHLLSKLPAAPVRREHYTAAQAGAPLDHFRWVRAAGPLAVRVAEFAAGVPATRPT
jgi:predicted alpha/beta hydrolase